MKKTDEIKEFSGYCENADNISEYTYTDNQYFSVGEEYSAQLKEGSSDKRNGKHLHKKKNLIQKMGYAVTAAVSVVVISQAAAVGGYDEPLRKQEPEEVVEETGGEKEENEWETTEEADREDNESEEEITELETEATVEEVETEQKENEWQTTTAELEEEIITESEEPSLVIKGKANIEESLDSIAGNWGSPGGDIFEFLPYDRTEIYEVVDGEYVRFQGNKAYIYIYATGETYHGTYESDDKTYIKVTTFGGKEIEIKVISMQPGRFDRPTMIINCEGIDYLVVPCS